jgi:hypothetical protein
MNTNTPTAAALVIDDDVAMEAHTEGGARAKVSCATSGLSLLLR